MAWTAPKTWVANAVLTAAELNTHLRDNFLETAPAKATVAGSLFVSTGANAIAQRTPNSARVTAPESTNSATYTNLTTPGPAVTLVTGASAFVIVTARAFDSDATAPAFMAFTVAGSTTRAAADQDAYAVGGASTNELARASAVTRVSGLTPGSNTFTAVYRSGHTGGNATFRDREISVIPL